MTPTLLEAMFEINFEAIVMVAMVAVTVVVAVTGTVVVAVTGVIFVWFQRSQAAASAMRTMRMMTRVGLDREAIMKEALRRCGSCRLEDLCDRWGAGKAPWLGSGRCFQTRLRET